MDNIQLWIYIIVGILYLIGRTRKKQHSPEPRQSKSSQKTESTEKPITFEDLLKEIMEGKELDLPPKTKPTPKPVQEYVDYDDEVEEENKSLEKNAYDYAEEDTYKTFQQSKYEAFNRKPYDDTLTLEDTKIEFGKFKAFEQEEKSKVFSKIAENLSDADKLKQAFIMNEILSRRYV